MFQDIGNNPDPMQVIQIFTGVPFCTNDFNEVINIRYIFILDLLFNSFLKFYQIQL